MGILDTLNHLEEVEKCRKEHFNENEYNSHKQVQLNIYNTLEEFFKDE